MSKFTYLDKKVITIFIQIYIFSSIPRRVFLSSLFEVAFKVVFDFRTDTYFTLRKKYQLVVTTWL